MIILSYVPGTPITAVEHVLRNFTQEYQYEKQSSLDGNLYRFLRPDTKVDKGENLVETMNQFNGTDTILQVMYPTENVKAKQILTDVENKKSSLDKHVFFAVDDMESAELLYIFFYYRIGITAWRGLDNVFIDCTEHSQYWNKDYNDHTLMQPWELRECFSLCYPGIAQEWIDAVNHIDSATTVINFTDLFLKPKETFRKIISSCGLTITSESELDQHLDDWIGKQKKELEEYQLINMIVEATINDQYLDWETTEPNAGQFLRGDTKLNTVSEAIIQQKLRSKGYEIICAGLNDFPTNSKALKNKLAPASEINAKLLYIQSKLRK